MSITLFPYLDRIFTQPGVEVELSSLSVQTPCQLRVLAVGGGGNGALGGGGSGYVQYFSQALTSTPSNIKLTVGDKVRDENGIFGNWKVKKNNLRPFYFSVIQKIQFGWWIYHLTLVEFFLSPTLVCTQEYHKISLFQLKNSMVHYVS